MSEIFTVYDTKHPGASSSDGTNNSETGEMNNEGEEFEKKSYLQLSVPALLDTQLVAEGISPKRLAKNGILDPLSVPISPLLPSYKKSDQQDNDDNSEIPSLDKTDLNTLFYSCLSPQARFMSDGSVSKDCSQVKLPNSACGGGDLVDFMKKTRGSDGGKYAAETSNTDEETDGEVEREYIQKIQYYGLPPAPKGVYIQPPLNRGRAERFRYLSQWYASQPVSKESREKQERLASCTKRANLVLLTLLGFGVLFVVGVVVISSLLG